MRTFHSIRVVPFDYTYIILMYRYSKVVVLSKYLSTAPVFEGRTAFCRLCGWLMLRGFKFEWTLQPSPPRRLSFSSVTWRRIGKKKRQKRQKKKRSSFRKEPTRNSYPKPTNRVKRLRVKISVQFKGIGKYIMYFVELNYIYVYRTLFQPFGCSPPFTIHTTYPPTSGRLSPLLLFAGCSLESFKMLVRTINCSLITKTVTV